MSSRDLMGAVRETFDGGDPWGSAIGWAFPIAETLHSMGETIPNEWEFRPSPLHWDLTVNSLAGTDDYGWETRVVALGIIEGEWNADDLRHVGSVLLRYCDLCKANGLDY